MTTKVFLILCSLGLVLSAQAKLKVITTTTTLAAFVEEVGGDKVEVISLTRATQDPHFVEAKPSFMVKLRNADLLVTVGLGLEVGWIGNVQRGAKNPKLLTGGVGFLSAGEHFQPIDVVEGKIDRAQGDMHGDGNPHFHLDPVRSAKVIEALAKKLGELDPGNRDFYSKLAKRYNSRLEKNLEAWQKRVAKTQIKKVITYHKSLDYFLRRFGLEAVSTIEPKPGIPPSAKHVISLIKTAKSKDVKCILNEAYFETTAAKRIKKEAKTPFEVVPVEVQSTYFDLIETHVKALEACKGASV